MRRLLYLAVLSMFVVALSASVALGQSRGPSGADGSFNCADFDDQGQAQEFFNNAGPGDPNGLDADSDGQACESLPTAVPADGGGTAFVPGEGEDIDDEPANESAAASVPAEDDAAATQYADDGEMSELPDTGGVSLFTLIAGLGLAAIGGLLYARLRRS